MGAQNGTKKYWMSEHFWRGGMEIPPLVHLRGRAMHLLGKLRFGRFSADY